MITELHRSLEQELQALLRGVSLECPACGEFVLHAHESIFCPECGLRMERLEAGSKRVRATG